MKNTSYFAAPVKAIRDNKDKEFPWKLDEELVYISQLLDRTIRVPKGFRTDFASVPRLPLAYLLTGDQVHAPAVVHDYLIRKGRLERQLCDKIFLEAMEADKVPKWRRYLMYWAVSGYTLGLDLVGAR